MSVELWGHPFGLRAAVAIHKRAPEFHVAVIRTLLSILCSNLDDDHLILGLDSSKDFGRRAYRGMCVLTGNVLDQEKRARVAPCVVRTGCELRPEQVISGACLTLAPKPGRLEKDFLPDPRRSSIRHLFARASGHHVG